PATGGTCRTPAGRCDRPRARRPRRAAGCERPTCPPDTPPNTGRVKTGRLAFRPRLLREARHAVGRTAPDPEGGRRVVFLEGDRPHPYLALSPDGRRRRPLRGRDQEPPPHHHRPEDGRAPHRAARLSARRRPLRDRRVERRGRPASVVVAEPP